MMPQGFEWFIVIWMYLRNLIGPIVVFVLVAVIAVMAFRINGRLKRLGDAAAAQTGAGCPANTSPKQADEANAKQAKLQRDLERARLEVDLADAGLTRRERTVLLATCEGMTLAALADDLGVSRSTVGTYSTRAYEKLGVSTREEAQAWLSRRAFAHALADKGLTDGEVEVALMAADGASTADIAQALTLSEAAINSRLQQAYGKLGIHSRANLAGLRDATVSR